MGHPSRPQRFTSSRPRWWWFECSCSRRRHEGRRCARLSRTQPIQRIHGMIAGNLTWSWLWKRSSFSCVSFAIHSRRRSLRSGFRNHYIFAKILNCTTLREYANDGNCYSHICMSFHRFVCVYIYTVIVIMAVWARVALVLVILSGLRFLNPVSGCSASTWKVCVETYHPANPAHAERPL